MAKLTNISIVDTVIGIKLRLDWDNDRHQAIAIDSLESEHIEDGLVRASVEINIERLNKEI